MSISSRENESNYNNADAIVELKITFQSIKQWGTDWKASSKRQHSQKELRWTTEDLPYGRQHHLPGYAGEYLSPTGQYSLYVCSISIRSEFFGTARGQQPPVFMNEPYKNISGHQHRVLFSEPYPHYFLCRHKLMG